MTEEELYCTMCDSLDGDCECEMQIRTLTYVDIFDEECFGPLYDMIDKAIRKSCVRHGLDPEDWETWAIGYTHHEVPETTIYDPGEKTS